MHFHIVENTPGYLPESDPIMTRTRAEAHRALVERARTYREDQADLPRRERRTGVGSARSGGYAFQRPGDPYDLGYVIELVACADGCVLEEN